MLTTQNTTRVTEYRRRKADRARTIERKAARRAKYAGVTA